MNDTFRARVLGTVQVSPQLRRITLGGPSLASWASTGMPDEFVHVHLPDADASDGWDTDHDAARHYTVRAWNTAALTMDLDIVTHGHGKGAAWALTAAPGSEAAVSAPHGYFSPPAGSMRRLLLADATGLPAVARILEEAGSHESFDVFVELASMGDAIALTSPAAVRSRWLVAGNGVSPSRLVDTMRTLPTPSPDTYVWVACESAESRRARTLIRAEWPRHHEWYRVVGYWHVDQEEQLRKWNALTDEQRETYTRLWDESRPDEVNWIELEPYLQKLGL